MKHTVSVAVDVFGAAISLVILLYLVLGDNRKVRQNRLFACIVACNLIILTVDALSWSFDGVPGPGSAVITRTVSLLGYLFMYAIIGAFTLYLAAYMQAKAPLSRPLVRAALWGCAFSILTVFLSQPGGLYYYIDADNLYHRGRLYWVSQILVFAGLLLNMALVASCRRALSRREYLSFLSYLLLPLLLNVLHILEYDVSWSCVASTLSVVIIYAGIQSEQSRRLARQAVELSDSRTAIMLSQIQGHFLYNTLGAIQDLCLRAPAQAERAVEDFTLYLRGNLDFLGYRNPIPFEKELEHTRVYLSLERMRFEERLQVEYDIAATGFELPALSVQPIVENAVKHGITQRVEGGKIVIRTRETQSDWQIIIEDNGVGYDTARPAGGNQTHIGVENVRRRLEALCGGALDIDSTPGVGTVARISLPKRGGRLP